ncbi:preprotein translocase subunit YajC [Planctomycetota bacterium]
MTHYLMLAWMHLAPLAAEGAAPAKGGKGGNPMTQSLLFIFVMFFILYFLMIRPQRKRAKERAGMLSGLNKGDHVITSGGIRGVITLVRDHEVVVKVGDNVSLTFLKSGVARVVADKGAVEDTSNK